jgi:hypothetical protein
MSDRATWAEARRRRQWEPVKRALLLMALGLDPCRTYSDAELRGAWRRQKMHRPPDGGSPGITAVAIDAAYATLVGATPAGPGVSLDI